MGCDALPPLQGAFDDVCPVDERKDSDGRAPAGNEDDLKDVAVLGYN